ncbi:hypothetical protein Tsubulata_030127 [Turnera subulata]|uniref:Malectin-like domain-containing protein n=1 Tax=Turnera subulata TaxID=218843 RepID=A0A9Q0FX35_9ROSI|nr:hypothetical protein Tsubulata_030127 [Turnera subulata]
MGGEIHRPKRSRPVSSLFLLLFSTLLFTHKSLTSAQDDQNSFSLETPYSPPDNYLLDCGSSSQDRTLDDGRTFKSDSAARGYLETIEQVQISVDSIPVNASSTFTPYALLLCRSARIFPAVAKYTFHVYHPGLHWLRFYFYAVPHPAYNLTSAVFDVLGDEFVLLHGFSMKGSEAVVFKEYLINANKAQFSITFKPRKDSFGFINALEFVSAPDELISDSASTVPQGGTFTGILGHALQVSYRLNIGGPIITTVNDTLSRTWIPDTAYNIFPEGAEPASVRPSTIKYPAKGATPYIAPAFVYATAEEMADSRTRQSNFNLTWKMDVDPGFSYLIRLHFCDIVSKSLNELYFNVYINDLMGVSSLDLSSITKSLSTAYYADLVINSKSVTNGSIMVQIGPPSGYQPGTPNGILNGLEVIKMSDTMRSLDDSYSAESFGYWQKMKIVAGVGIGFGVIAFLVLAVIFARSHKSPPPRDYEKRKSVSSWLLPNSSSKQFLQSSKTSSRRSSSYLSSRRSKSSHSTNFSNMGLGRFFSLSELQHATDNFDEKAVIGVGGFGKVYLGVLEDGTKAAIKRGNHGSDQGINEKKMIEKIVDPRIAGSICPGSLKKFVEAAEKCLAEHGADRPGMGDVLWNLEYALQLQDAFSQSSLTEDRSVIHIPFGEAEGKSIITTPSQASSSVGDDSELSVASPVYSRLQQIQGR